MPNLSLTPTQQARIVNHVRDVATDYEQQMTAWKERMTKVYKNIATFEADKQNPRDSTFKVNKGHTIENKVLPRIMAKNASWIVTHKSYDTFSNPPEGVDLDEIAEAIQDYLTTVFKKQDLVEVLRLWAKGFIRFGVSRVKIRYKYQIQRTSKKVEAPTDDSFYGKNIVRVTKKVDENVIDQYPCIDVKSRTDILIDPRYKRFEDMPAILDKTRNVRLASFTQNPKKYMNLADLVACCKSGTGDMEDYRNRILNETGIQLKGVSNMTPTTVDTTSYYGLYDITDSDDMSGEKLYKFVTTGDLVLVEAEEISQIPFEDIRCFEDTETYLATGFLEPIMGLQDEINFKKNSASRYINQSLYRDYIRSPMSGIDPRKLNGGAGNIVMTTADAQTAIANLQEIPHRQLPPEYFNEQNDFERQMQEATFTIDTSNAISQQSLTNTATGAKIQAYDSSAVMDEVRKHFEEGMVRLAYKLLQFTFDNLEGNIYIKQINGDGFREINKEAMRDALSKYDIQIVAGSSSFDSEENQRNDALAQRSITKEALTNGIPVNGKYVFEKVMDTFQGVDKAKLFEQQMPIPGMMPGVTPPPGTPPGGGGPLI